ncbi:MAG: hypothetical protein L0338_27080, partial [Acidobacteria bacterium]|nr:hypothetical protein [Acidobacteriota bacterium]
MLNSTSAPSAAHANPIPREHDFRALGIRIDAVQVLDVVEQAAQWIAPRDRCHYVAVTGMHGVMEAQKDAEFRAILNAADLVVPDGMPLVWLGRLR